MLIVFIVLSVVLEGLAPSSTRRELPSHIEPISHDLSLKIDTDQPDSYSGLIAIEIKCLSETPTIELHATSSAGLTVSQDSVKIRKITKTKKTPTPQSPTALAFDKYNEFLSLTFKDSLKKKEHYILEIPFTGRISDSMDGLMIIKNGTQNFIYSDFKRTFARRVFPCFDLPSIRTKFRMSIERKANAISISNTNLESQDSEKNPGWVVDMFKEIASVPTYLISFIVADSSLLTEVTGESGRRNLWCHLLASFPCERGLNLVNKMNTLIKDNSNIYGMENYLNNKLDYILVPGTTDVSVEKLGLIMKSEYTFATEASEYSVLESLLKQVFGMALSPSGWGSQWLLTCLARYIAITSKSNINIDSEKPFHSIFYITMVHSQKLSILRWDSKKESKSINTYSQSGIIEQEDSPQKLEKGLLILFMFVGALGENRFDEVVREFAKKFPKKFDEDAVYKFCYEIEKKKTYRKSNDYRNPLIELMPKNIHAEDIMKSWIDKAGFPVISVRRVGGGVTITQTRYFSRQERDSASDGCWWVPLTVVTAATGRADSAASPQEPATWLGCEQGFLSQTIAVGSSHWIVLNSRLSGLYRVYYGKEDWELIIQALNNKIEYKKIPVASRAQLVGDALEFSYSGDVDFETAFRLVSYLKQEGSDLELMIWMSFFDGYDKFKLAYKGSEVMREILKEFLRSILQKTYSSIFPTEQAVIDLIDSKASILSAIRLRIHEESCTSGVPMCRDHSKNLFQLWKSEDFHRGRLSNTYSKKLRISVLCAAVKASRDTLDVHYIFDTLKTIDDQDIDRESLVQALKCPEDHYVIEEVLKYCTSTTRNEVIEEKIDIFKGLLRENDALIQAGSYLFHNFDEINSFFSTWAEENSHNPAMDFVKIMACEMSDSQLQELHKHNPQGNENIRNILQREELKQCEDYQRDHKWAKQNERSLEEALRKVLGKGPDKLAHKLN